MSLTREELLLGDTEVIRITKGLALESSLLAEAQLTKALKLLADEYRRKWLPFKGIDTANAFLRQADELEELADGS